MEEKEIYDLLIVGNGFDLAHKLHTSYADFYNFMKFSVEYETKRSFIKNIEDYFKITYSPELDNLGMDFLSAKIGKRKDNFFVNYFCKYITVFDSWNGFESELREILIALDYLLDNLNYDNYSPRENLFRIRGINKNHGQCFIYENGIIDKWHGLTLYGDDKFESGFAIIEGIKPDRRPIFESKMLTLKNDIIEKLFDELKEFTNFFATYLNIFAHKEFTMFDFKIGFKKIISYNYTNTAQKRYNLADKDVFYIHGKFNKMDLCGKLINDDIIFGIDNYEFSNDKLCYFTKIEQRQKMNNKTTIYKFIGNFENVCIFGHSLDLLDKESLEIVLKKANKIIIYVLNDNEQSKIKRNLKALHLSRDIDDEIEKEIIEIRKSDEIDFLEMKKS